MMTLHDAWRKRLFAAIAALTALAATVPWAVSWLTARREDNSRELLRQALEPDPAGPRFATGETTRVEAMSSSGEVIQAELAAVKSATGKVVGHAPRLQRPLKAQEVAMVARIGRAGTFAAEGNHARAADGAEVLARQQNLAPIHAYDLACLYARTAGAVEQDLKLSPVDRTRLRASYADRAMVFLQDAVAGGYAHPVAMRADADLDPLRARDDFRKLIFDLEAQQKVSGDGKSSR
jgi:hypothetical protein